MSRHEPEITMARTIMYIAAEVEAAERAIKQAVRDAASAGDCERIIDLIDRWATVPTVEVLQGATPTPWSMTPPPTLPTTQPPT